MPIIFNYNLKNFPLRLLYIIHEIKIILDENNIGNSKIDFTFVITVA